MAHQGFDVQLTRYDERGWRATFYTTGMEHSPTSATGTGWERTEFAREGRKPLARLSTKSLVRARDAECICSHIYAGHRQERSEIATVCERCSCVGFAPRDQRAWNRLASSK